MGQKTKWSIYQVISFLILVLCIFSIHQWIAQGGIQSGNKNGMYAIYAMLFLFITWLYTMTFFQKEKYPTLLKDKTWRVMPIFIVIIGILSLGAFILLATIGPMLEWLEQSNWLIYLIMAYVCILYYVFIMTLVFKLSDHREKLVHQTYAWSLGILAVIVLFL